jgi:hypothetical protein
MCSANFAISTISWLFIIPDLPFLKIAALLSLLVASIQQPPHQPLPNLLQHPHQAPNSSPAVNLMLLNFCWPVDCCSCSCCRQFCVCCFIC